MKLWNKGYDLDREIEEYTVADDPQLDRALAEYDCTASMAHARALEKAGVLSAAEANEIIGALETLRESCRKGDFLIKPEEEDCHTAIENHLVSRLGEKGKKIHTARSRNDQVVAALRLYARDRLDRTSELVDDLIEAMGRRISEAGDVAMPGYTHTRKAMPSSLALWLGAFQESMEDNKKMLAAVRSLINQNPLGSGAGFGIPVLEIDRELTAKELGFDKVQENPLYVQNSRGKFEASVVFALANVMADLNKMAADLILFSMDEFGFFSLPMEICTGSSIMPHKLNPDVLEIMRAGYHDVLANEQGIRGIVSNLISGYHRDFQRTKKPLMESLDIIERSLKIMVHVMGKLKVDRAACEKACTEELLATREVYELVKKEIPFRDAYKQVAEKLTQKDQDE
ncbi:MAG: argininosuccinate lyase [Planctomycetota bacterium]